MRLLALIPLFALCGCTSYTRAEYEEAINLPILAEHEKDGTTLVVYGPDYDPRIDPATGIYVCPAGVRVAKFRNGVLIAKYFQEHGVLK